MADLSLERPAKKRKFNENESEPILAIHTPPQRITDCDKLNVNQDSKSLVHRLVHQNPLHVGTQCLTEEQQIELSEGILCLHNDYLGPLLHMIQSYIPKGENPNDDNDEVDLDLDQIDDTLQVKMYNYLIEALKQQERNQSKVHISTQHVQEVIELRERIVIIQTQIKSLNEVFQENTNPDIGSICNHNEKVQKLLDQMDINRKRLSDTKHRAHDVLQNVSKVIEGKISENKQSIKATVKSIENHQRKLRYFEQKLEELKHEDSALSQRQNANKQAIQDLEVDSMRDQDTNDESVGMNSEIVIAAALKTAEKTFSQWTTDDVLSWLRLIGFGEWEYENLHNAVRVTSISGRTLHREISGSYLTMLGLSEEDRKRLMNQIVRLRCYRTTDIASRYCILCVTNEIDSVIVPCGHQIYCDQCVVEKKIKLSECPLCRKSVEKMIPTTMNGFCRLE